MVNKQTSKYPKFHTITVRVIDVMHIFVSFKYKNFPFQGFEHVPNKIISSACCLKARK